MNYLLNLVYLLLLVGFAPVLLSRAIRQGKYREGWAEKLRGRAPRRIGESPCVWFHAVSVGEVMLLRPIVDEMARRRPSWEVVVSTTTSTGLEVARRIFPELVTFYAPLDFTWAVRRAVARIRPTVLALVELELWPNLIWAAKKSGARIMVVNGRISPRSHRGYMRIKRFLRSTIRRLDLVAAQSDDYAERFMALGVPSARVCVTGSIKYDGLEGDRDNQATLALRRELGLAPADLVFVAGSTMEGEEAAALEAYRAAKRHHPRLRLVVVPRHKERFDHVATWLEQQGEPVVRRSQKKAAPSPVPALVPAHGHAPDHAREGPAPRPPRAAAQPVILVDTLGELAAVWGLADVAFVGGSLTGKRGGQNMMEPAAYGAAVMFGPHTANFRDTVEQLLARQAARQVADAADLARALLDDLNDPESAAARGAAAREFVLAQNGATDRTLAELDRLVEDDPPYPGMHKRATRRVSWHGKLGGRG